MSIVSSKIVYNIIICITFLLICAIIIYCFNPDLSKLLFVICGTLMSYLTYRLSSKNVKCIKNKENSSTYICQIEGSRQYNVKAGNTQITGGFGFLTFLKEKLYDPAKEFLNVSFSSLEPTQNPRPPPPQQQQQQQQQQQPVVNIQNPQQQQQQQQQQPVVNIQNPPQQQQQQPVVNIQNPQPPPPQNKDNDDDDENYDDDNYGGSGETEIFSTYENPNIIKTSAPGQGNTPFDKHYREVISAIL